MMNQYVTGSLIRELREKNRMTQEQLAERLNVSFKTVSKWETGRGYPDITLLEPIAKVFGISVSELLAGESVTNQNRSANMMRSKIYVCPVCGNIIHAIGEGSFSCHGIMLKPCTPEAPDERHKIRIERSEDEYHVVIDHEMSKNHFISFIAAIGADQIQMVKLYPEGKCEARFKISGVMKIMYCCNQDGLFQISPRDLLKAG